MTSTWPNGEESISRPLETLPGVLCSASAVDAPDGGPPRLSQCNYFWWSLMKSLTMWLVYVSDHVSKDHVTWPQDAQYVLRWSLLVEARLNKWPPLDGSTVGCRCHGDTIPSWRWESLAEYLVVVEDMEDEFKNYECVTTMTMKSYEKT